MEGRRMPARYRMDESGQMRRTWNGKLPEEFNERDMLLFAADTDLALYGRVSDETLSAARKAGYSYENGALMPLQEIEHQKEGVMEQQNNTMGISVKVYPMKEDKGNLLAFASATIGGCFAVTGIKIVEGKDGPFVAMPQRMGRDKKYRDVCFPTTAAMREAINTVVMDAYRGELEQQAVRAAQAVERLSGRNAEKPSVRQALQDAAREAAARSSPAADRTMDQRAR